ncbi:MAG: purine-binding chemotaxis protein CheW [Deltaproteobacteria bacterium]|nr:purine-binding chemotaxis protein CheW [Deltaproteobacteria bacterium]
MAKKTSLSTAFPLEDPDSESILASRARALAIEEQTVTWAGHGFEAVVFSLSGERYGLDLIHVKEVVRVRQVTPMPGLPGFVAGITNVRGKIFSVIDLKFFFGLPGQDHFEHAWLVILGSKEMEFGILVDEIIGTRSIRADMIHTSMTTLTGIREKYLKGVTRDAVAILDGAKILSDEGLIVKQ